MAAHPEIAKVVDPVMVATSGVRLVSGVAVEALKRELLPIATVMTPNVPEAEVLSGRRIACRADVRGVARQLTETYGCSVLVKGGHAVGDLKAAEDTLYDGKEYFTYEMPWIDSPVSAHGTGCSLAAALVAELTMGRPLVEAVKGAKAYVHAAIKNSYLVGKDCGVLGFAWKC